MRGVLKGHKGWVTSIALIPNDKESEKNGIRKIISGSRDKTLIIWELKYTGEVTEFGTPVRSLEGHSHFIQDVAISNDGQFALSASWDTTLRLWNLETGNTTKTFSGHTKDVLSVAFSSSNNRIVSGSRDKTVKLWNTLGECKWTVDDKNNGHSSWVTSVRCSPESNDPVVVSVGWDNVVKVFDLGTMTLKHNLRRHTGFINVVSISPDGRICASGGKDGKINLWALPEPEKKEEGTQTKKEEKNLHLIELDASSPVYCLAFSPSRYWLVAGCEKILESLILELKKLLLILIGILLMIFIKFLKLQQQKDLQLLLLYGVTMETLFMQVIPIT